MMSVGVSIPMNSRCSDRSRASSTRATVISHDPVDPSAERTNAASRLELVAGDAWRRLHLANHREREIESR